MNILIVEDLPSDAELCRREIEKVLPSCEFRCVESREEFLEALDSFKPDIIVSDYKLPNFDGMKALKIALERVPDTPFIIATGSMNEDTAVECMKAGAWDYVIKEHIRRLGPAVLGALEQKRIRKEKQIAEEALRKSEHQLKEAQKLGRIGHWEYDLATEHLFWSDMVFAIFKRDPKLGPPTIEEEASCYTPEDAQRLRELARITFETGEPYETDVSLRLPNGKTGHVVAIGTPVRDSQGRITRLLGTVQDITERKRNEEMIRAALREKEVLLREIHHRVKNNMQIISSLLHLQEAFITDPRTLEIFKNTNRRIRAMALVHEKLYSSQDLSRIEFSEYISNLVVHLFQSHEVDSKLIRFLPHMEKVSLDINTAIPCSLIITELVSNALKHAFPAGSSGELCVELSKSEDETITIIVRDNGIGIPEQLDILGTNTLGMQIITTLVGQLEGSLKLAREKGTAITVAFKEPKYKQRI
jgi:two-component sensor histidine kinase/DNA-binding response OmpR family regulator